MLATTPRIRTIPLERITADPAVYPRSEPHSPEAISDLAEAIEAGADVPPAAVYHTPDTEYLLSEGFLRLAAYALAGRGSMPCEVRTGSRRAAILNAASSNRVPGVARRTTADKRRAVELVLAECPDWTDNRIAEHCGVTHPTVGAARRRLTPPQIENFATCPEIRVGRDGKSYPVLTPAPSPVPRDPDAPTIVGSVTRRPLPDGRPYPEMLAAHQFNQKHIALLDERMEKFYQSVYEQYGHLLSQAQVFELVRLAQRTLLPEVWS